LNYKYIDIYYIMYIPKNKKKQNTKGRPKKKASIKSIIKQEMNKVQEKKRINTVYSVTDFAIGQVNAGANGFYSDDITPQMITGVSASQRIGNEINICSLHMTLQLRQMSAGTAPVKLIFYMIQAKGFYQATSTTLVGTLFNSNNYIGTGSQIYDTGSDMNVDQIKNFRIIKKFIVNMQPDGFTGQQMPVAKTFGMKFKTPLNIRWYSANQADFSSGRIFLIGFSSNGNASTTTASTLANVPVTAINTGQFINYNIKWYYTDD